VLIVRSHHSNIGILNPCSVELCFRLSHIRFRSGPAFKKILRKLQRIGISLHSVVEQWYLRLDWGWKKWTGNRDSRVEPVPKTEDC
jgi:hypothetical protein